jgi:septum site-determining protein MinD
MFDFLLLCLQTTSAASIAYGLAAAGKKTCVIDFDIGLRNLDIHLGCERRVIFDFVNVLLKECTLGQALIKDKRQPNLYLLAASQTRDKTVLTEGAVGDLLMDLRRLGYDYIICDSPAGIESGARHAMYFADEAIICTNPEISSCRDSDKMVGFIASRSLRAINSNPLGAGGSGAGIETSFVTSSAVPGPVKQHLLVTRYDPERAEKEEALGLTDITELLGLPLVGVIPESKSVLTSCNLGQPVIMGEDNAANAYKDTVRRLLGEDVPLRFVNVEAKGFFAKFFGSK